MNEWILSIDSHLIESYWQYPFSVRPVHRSSYCTVRAVYNLACCTLLCVFAAVGRATRMRRHVYGDRWLSMCRGERQQSMWWSRVTSLSRDLVFISINHFRWHDVIVSSLDGGYSYDSTSTWVRFDGHSTAMWLSFDDEPQSNGSRTASRRSRIVVVTVISVTLYAVLGRQQWLDRNETKSKKCKSWKWWALICESSALSRTPVELQDHQGGANALRGMWALFVTQLSPVAPSATP